MISFKAEFASNTNIQKRLFLDIYRDEKASIVKFDTLSKNDENSIKEISKIWKNFAKKETFANDIYCEFEDMKKINERTGMHFYGLTLQQDKFEKIDPTKVLTLANVTPIRPGAFHESAVHLLDMLQVIPNSIYCCGEREFKKLGQRMLDFIIGNFKSTPIVVSPTEWSKKFYSGNGFSSMGNGLMIFKR